MMKLKLICSCTLLTFLSSFGENLQVTSYEDKQSENVARSLLEDQRYSEAIAYLRMELERAPQHGGRFTLLLLLADGLLKQGEYEEAMDVIDEAEYFIRSTSDQSKLNKLLDKHGMSRVEPQEADSTDELEGDVVIDTTSVLEEMEKQEVLITNSFFEIDIRNVLSDLSMESGIPILWDPTVKGLITYEAENQPLEQVLESILYPIGCAFSYYNDAYFVGSSSPEDPAFSLLSTTKVMTLSNIEATEAIDLLSEFYEPYVKASNATNMVCITAPRAITDRIYSDLAELDKPPTQISIEVIVAEISSHALRKMGLDWTLSHTSENVAWGLGTDHTSISPAALAGVYAETGKDFGSFTADLLGSLEALTEDGDAKIRANPRITTLNGRTAEIRLDRDQYFIIQTSSGQSQYQYNSLQSISSGIRLEITPYVSVSDEITVHVIPEVGDVVERGSEALPEINTRSANTSVRVSNGETFMIGGLKLELTENIGRKIPFLGSIPYLGYLFRYDEQSKKESEIIIFVTPKIIK